MESEKTKPDTDQPNDEVNESATDIAATEVESQQVITSSDPFPSTIDAEDIGNSETVRTIETSDIAANVAANESEPAAESATVQSGETATGEEVETPTETNEAEPPAETTEAEPPTETTEAKPQAETSEVEPLAETTETELPAETTEAEPPAETFKVEPLAETTEEEPPAETSETEPSVNVAAAPEITENVEPTAAAETTSNGTEEIIPSVDAEAASTVAEIPAKVDAPEAIEELKAPVDDEAVAMKAEIPATEEVTEETEKREATPASVKVTLPVAETAEPGETVDDTTQAHTSVTQDTEVKQTEPTTEDTTTVRSEMLATTAVEETREIVDVPKEQSTVKDDKDATATVKFQLLPTKQVVTIASPLSQTVQLLKEQLATEVKIEANVLQLSYQDSTLSDGTTLKDLNVQPNGTIELDVTSSNPTESPLRTSQTRTDLGTSDVITVRLIKENNDYEDVVVEIDRSFRRKPFLGGFRHKLTGVEYHHASAQTMPKPIPPSQIEKNNRDTQTVFESNRTTQTTNTTSTQMTKVGCYVSIVHDKVMYAGTYFTSEEFFERRLKAIIVLQSYFRRWQARNIVEELKQDRDRRLRWEQEEELRKRREKELRIKKEFERRMNPKTKEDFDLVYAALEKWRLEELEQINAELDGPERKAALCALLEQETQLIASIGRHKLEASKENKEKNVERFLSKAAAPKRWKAYDGRYTEMDTQYTIRAREMKEIYNSINMKFLTQDERLDILLTLKHTVKEHDCRLTRDIIELIDREADLLMRGVSDANLEGLRKRISTLFLQYCKNPLFNPEAAKLLKVPQDPSKLQKNIYFCTSANEYLPSTEFKIVSNSRNIGKSRKVHDHDNIARTRQDYSHYRTMLRDLRRVEEGYGDDSKIVYLVQEKDLQYLVENIWCSQSILSAWDDLYDLVLVRWDKLEEWSPWNCILLTKDEAVSHTRLDHLFEAYGQVFIQKVKNKHTLARIYFSRIPGMSEQLRAKLSGSQKMQGPSEIRGQRALKTS